MNGPGQITQLLNRWTDGDAAAADELAPLVYDELHRCAERLFRGERAGHTLQPTALVHEAYSRLIGESVPWQDRAHFFALAARMMRRLLINHAEAQRAEKRGGGELQLTLDEGQVAAASVAIELLDLDAALTALAAFDSRLAELVQLRYFGGLSIREMELVTGRSSSTLDRDLRLGRAWLQNRLSR